MSYESTEERQLVRASVREFCEKYVDPIAEEVDEQSRFPAENIKRIAEQDWFGIPYPVEYGGAGSDLLTCVIVIEELSRSCASTGVILAGHTLLACFPLFKYGTEEQKQRWLAPLCRGEILGSFALTEPGAGTDVGAISTTAVADGDSYVLNGTKTFITSAPVAGAFIVLASTDRAKGARGLSAFVVPAGTPGIRAGEHLDKMGIRAALTSEVVIKDCRIPKANLLGEEGMGFKIAMTTLDGGRISIAAQALGIAQAALDESIDYAKERVQFGKPIGSFQGVQWMISDMAVDVAAARHLTYQAAWCYDQGLPYATEAAMAKLFASEAAVRDSSHAIQIHGGIGFIKGHKVERLYRDAKATEIYEGTSEVMRMVIAGNLLR